MEVRLPRLGEGADSGTVSAVFVKEGDRVKHDQPVLELESEKAVATIPSPGSGVVQKIHVREGDEIKVGQLIVTLSDDGASEPPRARSIPAAEVPALEEDRESGDERDSPAEGSAAAEFIAEGDIVAPESGLAPASSPSIRKLARELGIDLNRVRGSERGGRIVLADVRRYIQTLQHLALQQKRPRGTAALPVAPVDFTRWGSIAREKVSTLRRTISSRMADSWNTIPHVTQFDEADVTDLLALRKKYAPKYEKRGAHLTLTSFALQAVVAALKKYPVFNASMDEATGEMVFKMYYHIGIAVDTEQGLIVPVIRDVEKKNLLELSSELRQLAERTRERKITIEEMQGGTFTISNQGGIGSRHFTPIINKPEAAILGIGQAYGKPLVWKGKIAERTVVPLSLSYDHRTIDGADAARFMVELVRFLEGYNEKDLAVREKGTP